MSLPGNPSCTDLRFQHQTHLFIFGDSFQLLQSTIDKLLPVSYQDSDQVGSILSLLFLLRNHNTEPTSLVTLVGTLYHHVPLALLNVDCEKTIARSRKEVNFGRGMGGGVPTQCDGACRLSTSVHPASPVSCISAP